MTWVLLTTGFLLAAAVLSAAGLVLKKNMHLWLASYWRPRLRRRSRRPDLVHVVFLFADHFEPYWGGSSRDLARTRAQEWCRQYPEVARKHRDAEGRHPQHTHFYPEEEYDPEILDELQALCRNGFGDVEVHLHHDGDTGEELRRKLTRFKNLLYSHHGLLRRNAVTGQIDYGFIHGNWALDNSRKDGKWCGVNDELTILKETGCYADFTLPSAPSDTQTRRINSLYWAHDDPARPKSHDAGRRLAKGHWDSQGLLMVQGPLALNWKSRKWGLFPRIENAEISSDNPPTRERVRLWAKQMIHVEGRPDHIIIKVHSHGTQESNRRAFFEEGMLDRLYGLLEETFRPEHGFGLHYRTAWETYETLRRLCEMDEARLEAVS
ncbi:MAG: hypothetical protein HY548_07725 [Elusimicrobia bacterium]|nr:hypothetical protein [Elusimicrobiota bacterium]